MLTNCKKIPKSECPDIWIRLPRHKWPKSWSSIEDPVVPLEWNLYGHPSAGLLWERQFEKILLKHVWEKILNWECLFFHLEKSYSYLSVCGWQVDLGEPTFFLDHVYLGCTQRQCEISKNICGQLQNHVWISNFRGESKEIAIPSKISNFLHGLMTWLVMQRSVWNDIVSWPTRRRNNSTKIQSMHRLMLPTCSQMLKLGTYKRFDILCMVSTWVCMIDYEMDESLLQTIMPFDLFHSTCIRLQTILSCVKHCQTMQSGTFSRLRFYVIFWGFKISIRYNIVRFWKSYVCSDQLDVQETNCCFAQFYRVRTHLFGRLDGLFALELWDLNVSIPGIGAIW